MAKDEGVAERIVSLIMPVIEGAGMEMVDLEYRREGSGWVLRIFIDKEGGVTLDDCTYISREVEAVVDPLDMVHHEYNLEVSSPGLNRPLKRESDFKRFIGKLAKIKTIEAIDGSRNFRGRIDGCENGVVFINVDGVVHDIPVTMVAKANLEYEFA